MHKKLIEDMLPLQAVNEASIKERVRRGHPGNLHLWWNRSPVNSSAALLYAALTDAEDPGAEENHRRIMQGLADGQPEAQEAARAVLRGREHDLPVMVDPFCGFGGLPIAAQQLGLRVEASDLNSVAALLTKAAAEIAPRFAGAFAVHPGLKDSPAAGADRDVPAGAPSIAEDVLWYGNLLEQWAREELVDLYPEEDGGPVSSWIWVRTAECPNPACRCRMPLSSDYVLSQSKGKEYWAEPIAAGGAVKFQIHRGICPAGKESNKMPGRGARYACSACGSLVGEEYIREQGRKGRLGMQMMAMVSLAGTTGHSGAKEKRFQAPNAVQETAAACTPPDDPPAGSIADNSRWFSPPRYGLTEYADLYSPRQLRMLCCLCDLIPRIQERVRTDALQEGMSADAAPLRDGGTGATAYSQAIGVYLSLAVSRMANFHSTISTWDHRSGSGRAVFTRQAIPMTWTFAEENPFSDATGNFRTVLSDVAASVARLSETEGVSVSQRDAIAMTYPKGCIFCSELPYYDNIGYADLSDYFYIWLRRCLKDTYPELFEKIVSSKEELSSIPEHYGGDAAAAFRSYREQLAALCRKLGESVSEEYPSLLFYEYTRSDETALRAAGEGTKTDAPDACALEFLLRVMAQNHLRVTGLWPVRTAKADDRYEAARIVVVFRRMTEGLPQITRRSWIIRVKKVLHERMEQLAAAGSAPEDIRIAALGFGLAEYSDYQRVINADGSEMSVHDAVVLICQEAVAWAEHRADTDRNPS